MSIFDKRPLSLILCIMLGGFVFFASESIFIRISLITLCVVLLTLYAVFTHRKIKKPLLAISAFSLLISMLLSFLYFDVYFRCENKHTGIHEFEAEVVDINSATYYTSFIVKSKKIDNDKSPSYHFILSMESENGMKIRDD